MSYYLKIPEDSKMEEKNLSREIFIHTQRQTWYLLKLMVTVMKKTSDKFVNEQKAKTWSLLIFHS